MLVYIYILHLILHYLLIIIKLYFILLYKGIININNYSVSNLPHAPLPLELELFGPDVPGLDHQHPVLREVAHHVTLIIFIY